jgi:hypothetical protein
MNQGKTNRIRLGHIAALALVGWYLMVPPQTRTWWIGRQYYDESASLSRWTIERSFDKAEVCQAARLAAQQQPGGAAMGMGHALCIATDDPSLRGS